MGLFDTISQLGSGINNSYKGAKRKASGIRRFINNDEIDRAGQAATFWSSTTHKSEVPWASKSTPALVLAMQNHWSNAATADQRGKISAGNFAATADSTGGIGAASASPSHTP